MAAKPAPITGVCHGCDQQSTELRRSTACNHRPLCPSCMEEYNRGHLLPHERNRLQLFYAGKLPMPGVTA